MYNSDLRPHSVGRALTADWSVNGFLWLSIRIFFKFRSECSVQSKNKKNSHRSPLQNCLRTSQGCARFPEILQNFSERQILWRMCLVLFHVLPLKFPIQTSLSVAPARSAVVDLRAGVRDAHPPWGSEFFQFHAVFRKIWQNHMLAPPWGVGSPSSEKSWIRHCSVFWHSTEFQQNEHTPELSALPAGCFMPEGILDVSDLCNGFTRF